MAGLDRAIRLGEEEKRDRLTAHLLEFLGWCERLPSSLALKEALTIRGVKAGPPAVPLAPQGRSRLEQFREWFSGWLPVVLTESQGA
jgi:dihydrodipicolinate synthase/N-acetylneuraminate lyase